MRKCIIGLLAIMLFSGCGAGTTFSVLTYDNVITAANEVRKGVDALNATVITDTARQQEYMIQSVGRGIKNLAVNQDIDPDQVEIIVQEVMTSLRSHLKNYAEQERRRAELHEITIDNINYIIQISEQGKKYVIYRSDMSTQWQDYLNSTARTFIKPVE